MGCLRDLLLFSRGLWLFLDLGLWWRGLSLGNIHSCDIIFVFDHDANETSTVHLASISAEDLSDVSFLLALEADCCLVSLDLTDDISNINLASFRNQPLDDRPLRHCW